jgi:hypothetical protein
MSPRSGPNTIIFWIVAKNLSIIINMDLGLQKDCLEAREIVSRPRRLLTSG